VASSINIRLVVNGLYQSFFGVVNHHAISNRRVSGRSMASRAARCTSIMRIKAAAAIDKQHHRKRQLVLG